MGYMRIKELRKEKCMTQTEVAESLGISRQVFANYENEINCPDVKMLIKIADFFDVTIDYLVGRTDDFGRVHRMEGENHDYEKELLSHFRYLDTVSQNKVIGYACALMKK